MSRYLNSQTRTDVVITAGMICQIDAIVERWSANLKNPPKEVINYFKAASRFIARGLKELNKDLTDEEIDRIYKMAETTRFKLSYVKCDLTNKSPENITYDITEDERDNIVEALCEVRCHDCDGCIPDCSVRQQFFKWDIAPIHEVTNNKYPCQYMDYNE